ncbi:MAG TPA: hypothetical protein VGD43_20270 [Micromonospora sp.]
MSRTPRPHRPGRPHWRCTACGAPYPCGPGRVALLMAFDRDRVALAVLLGDLMLTAARDFHLLGHDGDIPGLHARFLAWLRREGGMLPASAPE